MHVNLIFQGNHPIWDGKIYHFNLDCHGGILVFPSIWVLNVFSHPAQVGRIGLGLGLSRSMEHPLLLDRRWIRRIRSRHRTRGGGHFFGKRNPRIELDTYSDRCFDPGSFG